MNKEYHILSLSGGKDSTALAFFIKENMPDVFEQMELVFFDTECELPETYEYLNKIEIFLEKTITKIKPFKSFDDFYTLANSSKNSFRRTSSSISDIVKISSKLNLFNRLANFKMYCLSIQHPFDNFPVNLLKIICGCNFFQC